MVRTRRNIRFSRSGLSRGTAVGVVAVVVATTGLASFPATAVPASFPSVDFGAVEFHGTRSYNYGDPAPSPRALIIGSVTRTIFLRTDFAPLVLTCTMTAASGEVIPISQKPASNDATGALTVEVGIPAGRVIKGSGETFSIECRGRDADPQEALSSTWIARYLLTEGEGAAATERFGTRLGSGKLDEPGAVNQLSLFAGLLDFPAEATAVIQVVRPGDRVRVYAFDGAFAQQGRTSNYIVKVSAGSTSLAGLDVSTASFGRIIGFTVPSGLPAGRVTFGIKTVATTTGALGTDRTPTRLVAVSRWAGAADYDPNLDGRSVQPSASLRVTGDPNVSRTLTAAPGTWSPSPVSTAYQWLRNGIPIVGASGASYLVTAVDFDQMVNVSLTTDKPGYRTMVRSSVPPRIRGGGGVG